MFTQEEYYWAWAVYLFGVVLFMFATWMFTRPIKWRGLRYTLRALAAVLFLMPWSSESDSEFLSPAWLVSGIEGAFEGGNAFWRAGQPLIIALLITLLIFSVLFTFLWYRTRQASNDA